METNICPYAGYTQPLLPSDGSCLYLEDICHTGASGKRNDSKAGRKYEERKNSYCRIFLIQRDDTEEKIAAIQRYAGRDMEKLLGTILTTPFVQAYEKDGYFFMETVNSIYVFAKK